MADDTIEAAPVEETVEPQPANGEDWLSPRSLEAGGIVEVRDATKREIDVRLLPWDTTIDTLMGPEEFARGSFAGTPPDGLYLMEPEHAGVQLAVGQDGRPTPTRVPVGRSTAFWEGTDGPYATFRVARTAKGDETLALAADRILSGVSAEFSEVPGGTVVVTRGGSRIRRHQQVRAVGAVLTHRPAYGDQAAVLAVRSQQPEVEGVTTVTETQEAPDAGATIVQTSPAVLTPEVFTRAIGDLAVQLNRPIDEVMARLDRMEEQARASFAMPGGSNAATGHPDDFHRGDWAHLVLRMMTGETVNQQEIRARTAADLITTDNLGVIPTAYMSEIIGIIDDSRPFLDSTTRLPLPRAGTTLSVPKIVTRPTTGIQGTEKTELTSTATSITPSTFGMVSIGGYGDISVQLLKRSDPSYLQLYMDLLAEAYAIDADDKAVDVLLAESAVAEGGELDPEALSLGSAWSNAASVSRRLKLDRIWLSTAAVAAFIDAKNPLNNAPLYSTLAADITAGNGVGGTISGLRPVHVPALDDESVDIIVGPSRGFGWTEDGTYTLQVDVPAKAGRDVGIIGMAWFAPLYPAAFTTYTLPAS